MSHIHTKARHNFPDFCAVCGCNTLVPKSGCSTIDSSCINIRRGEVSGIDNSNLDQVTCVCGCVWLIHDEVSVNCPNCGERLTMVDQEEYQNVIRAAYSLCQQIYDMELAGAIVRATLRQKDGSFQYHDSRDPLGLELEEELALLHTLLGAKNNFPKTFLEGCKNAPTTPKFIKPYSSFISNNPS